MSSNEAGGAVARYSCCYFKCSKPSGKGCKRLGSTANSLPANPCLNNKYLRQFLNVTHCAFAQILETSYNFCTDRSVKHFALPKMPFACAGRYNWLYAGAPTAARASATFFSLVETAKRRVMRDA
jgi:hypothetical protein